MMTSPAHVVDNIAYFQEREWADLHRRNVNWTGQAISIKDWAYVWLRRQLRVKTCQLCLCMAIGLCIPVFIIRSCDRNKGRHGEQSELEIFKTALIQVCITHLLPFRLAKISIIIKKGICGPIGMYKRKRHSQTVFVGLQVKKTIALSWCIWTVFHSSGFPCPPPPRVRGVGDQPALKYWCLRFYFVTWLSDQQVCQRSQRIGQHTTHSPDLLQVLAQLCYLKTKSAYSRLR